MSAASERAQRAHTTPKSGVMCSSSSSLRSEWSGLAGLDRLPRSPPRWAGVGSLRSPTHHSPPANNDNDNTINTYQKPPRTCIPIHIPKNRFPCPPPSPPSPANIRYSFNAPSYPLERNASIACPNAPTPGKIKLSARSMSAIEVTGVIE